MTSFTLSKEQNEKIQNWLKNEVYPEIIKLQRDNYIKPYRVMVESWEDGYPYMGAIGGGLTYSFTPTSIGISEKVYYAKDTCYERSLDITDYDSW